MAKTTSVHADIFTYVKMAVVGCPGMEEECKGNFLGHCNSGQCKTFLDGSDTDLLRFSHYLVHVLFSWTVVSFQGHSSINQFKLKTRSLHKLLSDQLQTLYYC